MFGNNLPTTCPRKLNEYGWLTIKNKRLTETSNGTRLSFNGHKNTEYQLKI